MSSQGKGLRFDLFERVHVPSFLPAIGVLDELELVPEIECVEEQAMVVMRGHFRLSVDYVQKETTTVSGEADGGRQRFEHLIPVDITLPRRRIERMEDVRVVIETYDTEQISERELNLSVVVELQGISREATETGTGMPTTSAAGKRKKASRADRSPELDEQNDGDNDENNDEQIAEYGEQQDEAHQRDEWLSAPTFEPFFEQNDARANDAVDDEDVDGDDSDVFVEPERKQTPKAKSKPKHPSTRVSSAPEQVASAAPAVKDTLVAPIADVVPETNDIVAVSQPAPVKSGMEWTRTFLRDASSPSNVGRKRMCIVQKDDSLDSIAARYGLHAQELVMFNRLPDRQLQAGQILYIPLSG